MSSPLIASEHSEQCALIEICRLHEGRYPALANLAAIPNGGHRHKAVAAKLAAEGVSGGFPDLFLAHPGTFKDPSIPGWGDWQGLRYPGLFIELKRVGWVPSDLKPAQEEWGRRLQAAGYAWRVCGGWEQAWAGIRSYLGIAEHVR